MAEEKFSLKKFLDLSPTAWYKVAGLSLKVFLLVLVVFGAIAIVNKFFPKKPDNVNQPVINLGEGGTSNYTVIQKTEDDRPWYIPSPFVEIFIQKSDDRDWDKGLRTGARWDF